MADDLIEPYRAIVDVAVHSQIGPNVILTKAERREIALVLHSACNVDGVKVNIMSSIDTMVESLKRIIMEETEEMIKLPIILPVEYMNGITE